DRRGLGLRPRGREGLNLSAAHVAELCGEIAPLVRGAEIREVLGLPPRDLAGGTVADLAPVRADRIAILEVRGAAAGERRALVLELFGRRANLVLLGPGDRVVGVLVEPSGSGKPRIEVGATWHPPPGKAGEPGPPISEAFPGVEGAPFAPLSRI